MGGGEHLYVSLVARAPLRPHSPGECGDWVDTASNDSRVESTTTTEYATPDSTTVSSEIFHSALEDFPSEQSPAEFPRVSSALEACSDEQHPSETSRLSRDQPEEMGAELSDTSTSAGTNKEERPTARIGDSQRVDIRSASSPVSSINSSVYLIGKAYLYLKDEGSSSSDVRTSCGSGPSGVHQGAWDKYGSPSSGGPCSSPAAHRGKSSSEQSTITLVDRLEDHPFVTHIREHGPKRRGRKLWVRVWAGLRRRFQQIGRRRKHILRAGSLRQPGKTTADSVQEDEGEDNPTSGELYTSSARWGVRSLYHRLVSYLGTVAGRG